MALVRTDGRAVGHGGGAGMGPGRVFDAREGTACEEFDPRPFSDRKLVPEDGEGCARMCDALALGTTATSEHRRVRGVDHGVNMKRGDLAVPRHSSGHKKLRSDGLDLQRTYETVGLSKNLTGFP